MHAHVQDTVIREATIMRRQRHPHILELLAVFVDGSDLWMVIPFVPGGSLESLIRKGYQKVCCCSLLLPSKRCKAPSLAIYLFQAMLPGIHEDSSIPCSVLSRTSFDTMVCF